MNIKYPVMCPLMEREITIGECFDIHMVVARCAPTYTVPEKVTSTDGYKEICENCQFHRND